MATSSPLRATSPFSVWGPLAAVAIVGHGLAAGILKHSGIGMGAFCVWLVIGKTLASWGAWGAFGPRPLVDRASMPFLRAAFLGAVLNGLAWVAYIIAVDRGPLSIVQTLTAAYSCVTVVLSVWLLRERLTTIQVCGVILVVVATMIVGYTGDGGGGGHRVGWLVATVIATVLWGASGAVLRHAYRLDRADDHRGGIANWLGLVVTVLPYGLFFAPAETAPVNQGLALAAVGLYILADLTMYAAMARGPASIVNPLISLYPIPTILYAALLLGESLSGKWLAVALTLPGIVLVLPREENPIVRLLSASWFSRRREPQAESRGDAERDSGTNSSGQTTEPTSWGASEERGSVVRIRTSIRGSKAA